MGRQILGWTDTVLDECRTLWGEVSMYFWHRSVGTMPSFLHGIGWSRYQTPIPKGGGGVWYSCIQRAIMGYSLREDAN